MPRAALSAFVFIFLGASSLAGALPAPLSGVSLGQSRNDVEKALGKTKKKVLSSTRAQEYADGLLRSDFLAAMNRAGAKHTLLQEPATRGVSVVVSESKDGTSYLGFAQNKLETVFVRTTVKPDTKVGGSRNAHHRDRLAPIRNHVESLRRGGCTLEPQKSGRNAFLYRGRCGPSKVHVEYHPERDEFWVVHFN